ncbi:hypothetical protein CQ046_11735 [Chryseobacterium sp. MYb7]|uniref:hypothetical protein n=1 Tax=Chryseobacterium sp. MYb7 TaxID=1827290 RepID=UPI000D4D47EF|nr:hypothetical protein [Chryseobacterium sp. MYb7]PRB02867.1 hypothetical protein CQ046_11735 [Chryseobacterium sp. MYb7]
MKRIFLSILLITSFSTFFKSQTSQPITMVDYPNFYGQIISNLNNIIPNKTNYYNQPLSVFLQNLSQNNLSIQSYYPDSGYLRLMFVGDAETRSEIRKKDYANPYIDIYFTQTFDFQQATAIINQYHWFWNPTAENFYKNLIIKKITFWDINGLTNKNGGPQ